VYYLFTLWIIYCICSLTCKLYKRGFHTVDFLKLENAILCYDCHELDMKSVHSCQYQACGFCDVMPCSLKMKAPGPFKMPVPIRQTTQHYSYNTNNIWDFNVYSLKCTCIVCLQVHVIRNSIHHHSVLYLISLLTLYIDILYSIFSFTPVLHTHENTII
jgi:hypothetical protein